MEGWAGWPQGCEKKRVCQWERAGSVKTHTFLLYPAGTHLTEMESVSFIPRSAYEMDSPTKSNYNKVTTVLTYLGSWLPPAQKGHPRSVSTHTSLTSFPPTYTSKTTWVRASPCACRAGSSYSKHVHCICSVQEAWLRCHSKLVPSPSQLSKVLQKTEDAGRDWCRYYMGRMSSEGEESYNWLLMNSFHTMLRTVWLRRSPAFWLCAVPSGGPGT